MKTSPNPVIGQLPYSNNVARASIKRSSPSIRLTWLRPRPSVALKDDDEGKLPIEVAFLPVREIYKTVDLPDGTGRLVLFQWGNRRGGDENLVCFEADGQVRWRAQLPTTDPNDCFVAVTLDSNLILANSMSCYAVWIDPLSGKLLREQFTK